MDSPIGLYGDLENNHFCHSQPMEDDECIRDVVRSTEMLMDSKFSYASNHDY